MDIGMPLKRGWQLEAKFVVREGGATLAELHVYPALPVPDPEDIPMPILSGGYWIDDLYRLDATSDDVRSGLERLTSYYRAELQDRLTGTDLHRIQVTKLAAALDRFFGERGKAPTMEPTGLPTLGRGAKARPSQRGRPLGDDYWSRLSEHYLLAQQLNPITPNASLERRYREQGLYAEANRPLLRSRINDAHKKGWLKRTGRGPRGTGSVPGPRLIAYRNAARRAEDGRRKEE
jgi:hypothetical protein